MRKVLTFVAFAVLVAFVMVSLNASAALAATKTGKDKAKTTMVMGVLEEANGEYMIKRGKTTTMVTGQDFAPMKGKKVKATGTMTKGAKGNVLEVSKITEVTEVKKKGK